MISGNRKMQKASPTFPYAGIIRIRFQGMFSVLLFFPDTPKAISNVKEEEHEVHSIQNILCTIILKGIQKIFFILNRSEFPITTTSLKAMLSAESVGLRKPAPATGIASAL